MEEMKALVLGGTVPHIELIQNLKSRGYYTILIDYYSNPPAKEFADLHIQESTLDKECVLKIAKEYKVSLVISTCVDQANSICCYVAEKLGLPHPYSYQTSLDVTDKCRMKKIMCDNEIPTSKFVEVECLDEFDDASLTYPLIVKPADSNSSNGVKKVNNSIELNHYFPIAKQYSRNKRVIIEEFVDGDEIGVYFVIKDGEAHLVMSLQRFSVIDGAKNVMKMYAALSPALVSHHVISKCKLIGNQIAQVFQLQNTPLFFQAIVNNDEVNVIEFAPRVGGGMSSKTIKMGTGLDMIEVAVNSFIGEPIDLSQLSEWDDFIVVNHVYGNNGVFSRAEGFEGLKENNIIEQYHFYKQPGTEINDNSASASRIGAMIFRDKKHNSLLNKIKIAFDSIDCFDDKGCSMVRRDLNLFNMMKSSLLFSNNDLK